MNVENEGRVLNINLEQALLRLSKIDAKYQYSVFQKRYVYDFHPVVKGKWIRLRSNGLISTLTIKEILNNSVSGTKELEIEVSDFEKTNELLNQLGYMPRSYQENFRIEFEGEDYKADIDYWPQLGSYLEIEADTSERVMQVFSLLGFERKDIIGDNVDLLYRKKGIDLDKIKCLQFSFEEKAHLHEIAKGLSIDDKK